MLCSFLVVNVSCLVRDGMMLKTIMFITNSKLRVRIQTGELPAARGRASSSTNRPDEVFFCSPKEKRICQSNTCVKQRETHTSRCAST